MVFFPPLISMPFDGAQRKSPTGASQTPPTVPCVPEFLFPTPLSKVRPPEGFGCLFHFHRCTDLPPTRGNNIIFTPLPVVVFCESWFFFCLLLLLKALWPSPRSPPPPFVFWTFPPFFSQFAALWLRRLAFSPFLVGPPHSSSPVSFPITHVPCRSLIFNVPVPRREPRTFFSWFFRRGNLPLGLTFSVCLRNIQPVFTHYSCSPPRLFFVLPWPDLPDRTIQHHL